MKGIFAFLAGMVLLLSGARADTGASNQAGAEWNKRFQASTDAAIRAYPDLADENSAFAKEVTAEIGRLQSANDPLLSRADFPEIIAERVAKKLGVSPRRHSAFPSKVVSSALEKKARRDAAILTNILNEPREKEELRLATEAAAEANAHSGYYAIVNDGSSRTYQIHNKAIQSLSSTFWINPGQVFILAGYVERSGHSWIPSGDKTLSLVKSGEFFFILPSSGLLYAKASQSDRVTRRGLAYKQTSKEVARSFYRQIELAGERHKLQDQIREREFMRESAQAAIDQAETDAMHARHEAERAAYQQQLQLEDMRRELDEMRSEQWQRATDQWLRDGRRRWRSQY